MKLTPVTNPMDARLDAKANKVDTQNNLGDMVGLLAGWTADMRGGRNLLLNSAVNVTTSEYLTASVNLAPNHGLVDGDTISISIKGLLGSDRTHFTIYNSSGVVVITSLNKPSRGDDGVYRITGKWNEGGTANRFINIYAFSSTSTTETTIEWIKLERGAKHTPWTPAPEDAVAGIKASGMSEPLSNPLAPIDHSLALRLDTTVGTRIFAGDTMIYGDTGWMDITHLLKVPATSGIIHMRRTQEGTTIRFVDILYNELPELYILDVPVGYRPRAATASIIVSGPNLWDVWNNGRLYAWGMKAGFASKGQSTYASTTAWPTSLPGLPV